MKLIRILFFTALATIMVSAGIGHQAAAQQGSEGKSQRAIPRREPLVGLDKLISAYRVQLIDAHTLMAMVKAQRDKNQTLLDLLKSFQQDEMDALTLKRRVAEIVKPEYVGSLAAQQGSEGKSQRAIPRREPLVGLDKLISAYRVQLIDAHTLMAMVKAQRDKNQTLLDLLKSFQQDEMDALTLKRRVAEIVKPEYSQQANARLCEDFADGYEVGCMLNSGPSCREEADAMYCACLGGYNAGGGFCLTYN